MHQFDFKTIVLAKHAQHVVLIHFPVALFAASVLFDVTARIRQSAALATTAYWNLVGAAASVPPTIATGLLAWQWQLDGKKIRGTLLLHLILASVAGLFICILAGVRYRNRGTRERPQSAGYLLASSVVVALLALTAHLGGILSGVNIEAP